MGTKSSKHVQMSPKKSPKASPRPKEKKLLHITRNARLVPDGRGSWGSFKRDDGVHYWFLSNEAVNHPDILTQTLVKDSNRVVVVYPSTYEDEREMRGWDLPFLPDAKLHRPRVVLCIDL